jgi:hypothetical protein
MSRSAISESLLEAVEQLRPELPTLLGTGYTTFVTQLETSLAGESESLVWDLFEKYPAANERLQEILEQQEEEEDIIRGGLLRLFGDPLSLGNRMERPALLYRCKTESGLHDVTADQVDERDAIGNALCPQHGAPMIQVVKKENESN